MEKSINTHRKRAAIIGISHIWDRSTSNDPNLGHISRDPPIPKVVRLNPKVMGGERRGRAGEAQWLVEFQVEVGSARQYCCTYQVEGSEIRQKTHQLREVGRLSHCWAQ